MNEGNVKIKICGLMRPEDADSVNAAMPDFCGFVFAEGSKRYVTPEQASLIRERLDPKIRPVGVFVNAEPEYAASLADWGFIDMIQLHGNENEAYIAKLKKLTDATVIKAFRIEKRSDLKSAVRSSADMILLDHGDGGSGECFAWSLLDDYEIKKPWILAGGLHARNIREAVRKYHPYAVDLSSGAETDGCKDPEKIRACVEAVRNAFARSCLNTIN